MTGVRYLEHAAQLGHPEAMTRIGYIYEHGLYGTPVHLAKSFGYYDVASCQHNEPLAMLGLSRLYNRGCHGPGDTVQEQERLVRDVSGWLAATARNEDAAFSWCQKAANLGLDEAMFLLGYSINNGKERERSQRRGPLILFTVTPKKDGTTKRALASYEIIQRHKNISARLLREVTQVP